MLYQDAILEQKNVGGNPVRWKTHSREASMNNDVIAVGHDDTNLMFEGRRQGLDQIEEAVPAGSDVGAMLDIIRRPEALCRFVVAFVEERIKRLKNDSFVIFCSHGTHSLPL